MMYTFLYRPVSISVSDRLKKDCYIGK